MGKFAIAKVATEKTNTWVEDVAELNTATEADAEAGATFTISVKDESREVGMIRDAAKALNKTVRIIKRDDSAVTKVGNKENGKAILEGDVTLTIALRERYKEGRGRKPGSVNGTTIPAEPVAVSSKTK